MKLILKLLLVIWVVGWILVGGASVWAASEVPRISKEELRALLDNSQVVIIDVRQARDWQSSEYKIRGAIRHEPNEFDIWADDYPKDKTLVLYCA